MILKIKYIFLFSGIRGGNWLVWLRYLGVQTAGRRTSRDLRRIRYQAQRASPGSGCRSDRAASGPDRHVQAGGWTQAQVCWTDGRLKTGHRPC